MMSATIYKHEKVNVLRELEEYAYQVTHFILQDGAMAEEAAKIALIDIYREGILLEASKEELCSQIKRLTIKASITIACQSHFHPKRQIVY